MKVIVFDIGAPFGHFRVPYTTTSPVTLPIPPKTAIAGMIGAIIGLDKDEYLKYFSAENFKVAIRVLNPINMLHINENFINVKVAKFFGRMVLGKANRTRINIEFLKNPKFRLYIWHGRNELYDNLKKQLEKHRSYYTLTMGLSECIANYEYKGEHILSMVENNHDDMVSLHSVLPLSNFNAIVNNFKLGSVKRYLKVRLPVELSVERELIKTEDVLIERDGKTVDVKLGSFYHIEGMDDNVVLF